ncbi:whirlin protein dyschronic [Lycorma delicatula]|uniref:whirlin protein dyschronic n=1 Tax=Lycorma delicatula TaxID=130591 RepID=UPI003F510E99
MAEEELRELADINLSHQYGGGRWGSGDHYGSGSGAWGRSPGGGGSLSHHRATPMQGHSVRAAEAEDIMGRGGSTGPRGRSGLYYSPPGTSYTIVERPPPRGTYLGPTTANNNVHNQQHQHQQQQRTPAGKKRPISPEQVLKLFGGHDNGSPVEKPHRPSPGPRVDPRTLPVRTVNMSRGPPGSDQAHGFGICVKGGTKDSGVGVYISRVEEGSLAERAGLRPGDSILEVNGTPFTGISHEEALKEFEAGFTRAPDVPRLDKPRTAPRDEEVTKMLKSCRQLSMTVRSPNLPSSTSAQAGGQTGPWVLRQTYSWIDRQGRPVSPPPEYARASPPVLVPPPPPPPPPRWNYQRPNKDKVIRKVELSIEPGQSLGLMIRGGIEYNLGIFITGVDKDSVADRAGLLIGDQILEVNGQSFLELTHDEAVNQLKQHKRMTLIVRDVGKVPHSCTAYEPEPWETPQGFNPVGKSAALQMVDEKARCVLSKAEFSTLSYYLDEYSARQMTIEAFVAVLLELLNTPDKYTLLTELREVVVPEDRARFDELVYRRESEGQRLQHLMDARHTGRRKGGNQMMCCDNNHSILMSNLHDMPGPPEYYSSTRPCKFPPSTGEGFTEQEDFRTPSEDSGLGLGPEPPNSRTYSRGWFPGPAHKHTSDLALSGDEDFHQSVGMCNWGRNALTELGSTAEVGLVNPTNNIYIRIKKSVRRYLKQQLSKVNVSDYTGSFGNIVESPIFEYGDDGEGDLNRRRHSSLAGSVTQLNQSSYDEANMKDNLKCGYLEGLRSHLGGWTQKVKSWYWGNPLVS